MSDDKNYLLTDEFIEFSIKIKEIHEKKKIKKQELKEFYDKIMAEINEMDQQITELEQQKSAKKQELNKFYESVQPEMKSLDAEAKELEDAFLQWKDGKSK